MDAWITFVENDESCLQALVFADSLRRTCTNRKIMVLVGPLISVETRHRLENVFDGIFKIDRDLLKIKGLSVKNCAMLHCWSLTMFKKLIFVDSSLLMIRNCDNLFEEESGNMHKVIDCPEASIFVLSPSTDIFQDLFRELETNNRSGTNGTVGPDPNIYFRNWLICPASFQTEKRRFMISIDLEKEFSPTGDSEYFQPGVVQFLGKSPYKLMSKDGTIVMSTKTGTFEKEIMKYWISLYEDVNQISSPSIPSSVRSGHDPIAIIGMAARLPGANNVDEFWNVLINGQDEMIQVIPENRWTTEQSCVVNPEGRKIQAGLLKCPVDEFDGKFFRMSPMELLNTDPQQRFLLEVSWEALEDAGIDPSSLKGNRTGIFTGTWTNDYKDLMIESGFRGTEFYRSYMGNSYGASSGRLAHFLESTGTNISTESGCSSSMVAVGLACSSLRNGESNLALAAGVNLLLRPFTFEDWKVVISPDGRCKTFDSKANGYGRAEGCGVLVLKRLSDAVRDGDPIRAVIRGYGQTQEGTSASMGTPTLECESLAMKLALSDANIEPNQVRYVEAHGTGTKVGDPLEMEAIQIVYSKNRTKPLIVGSVKTNVGHTESSAGITGIIKTVLSLENEIIPPHINFETLNPKINLEAIPAEIPRSPKPWKRAKGQRRIAGVSSFGITGSDCHLIIEESPILPSINTVSRIQPSSRVLTLSAKSEDALDDLVESYEKYLKLNSMNLSDVAFSANTGRAHFPFRTAIVAESCKEVLTKIETRSFETNECQGDRPKLCFLFTGQGSQFHGMGKTLYEICPVFRSSFDTCDEMLSNLYGLSIRKVLWSIEPTEDLNRTIYSQTSIFVIEYCLMKVWESWGLKPDSVIGHSLGEFVAATAAGILTLKDALKLVAERSRLIDSLESGKMLVVRTTKQTIEALLKNVNENNNKEDFWVDFAATNSPEQTVVSGCEKSIMTFAKICENNGLKTHILDATHAFHSRAMDPILEEYRTIASEIEYSNPTCTYISGMDGMKVENGIDANYWVRHTRESVKFSEACDVLKNEEGSQNIFLEVGPRPVLIALLAQNIEDLSPKSLQFSIKKGQNEWTTMLNSLANLYLQGFEINWKEFHRYYSSEKVNLPFYKFQRSKYWFPPSVTNKLSSLGKDLHPLLGFPLPNASSQKVFHNYLDLNQKAMFLKDHLVGKTIIFPAACYTELAVATGQAVNFEDSEQYELPEMPILIKNLVFKAPLAIKGESGCQIQIIVSNIDSSEESKKIDMYKLLEDGLQKTWVPHAEGILTSDTVEMDLIVRQQPSLDKLKREFKVEGNPQDFYSIAASVGLNLGASFQGMKKVWKDGQDIFAEVAVPDDYKDYFVHPIVIDCMLQSLMIDTNLKDTLHLPLSIGKFMFLNKGKSQVNYIHSIRSSGKSNDSILYAEDGTVLAVLIGADIVPTSLEAITKIVEMQEQKLPKTFEEVWKPQKKALLEQVQLPQEAQKSIGIWIVLSEKETLLHDLKMDLEQNGNVVVNMQIGTKFSKLSDTEVFVRPDVKEDMELAMSSIKSVYPQLQIQGVVYLWGMNTTLNSSVISLGFLNLIQALANTNNMVDLFVITEGAVYIGDQEPVNPAGGTLWGFARTFRSENQFVRCRCIDIVPSSESHSIINKHVLEELWNSDEEWQVAYRNGERFVPRLNSVSLPVKSLPIPNSGRYSLVHPQSKTITDLKFAIAGKKSISRNGLEIQVKALGLNFKELLNISKPDSQFEKTDSIGIDFAGVITEIGPEVTSRKVGDAVIGYGFENGPLPSHISTVEDLVVALPNDMTFAEGASLPCAFSTFHLGLMGENNLKRGDTILIHTASGAVGLMAIQLAKHLGAEVIATAGSRRKRTYLRSLGVQHVFDSRSLGFGEEIEKMTNGKGVNVVLNSLTGPGFKETSLNALGANGTFVEMSKLNIWKSEEVASIRPDVIYSIVDLTAQSDQKAKQLHGHLENFLADKVIRPLPIVSFDAPNVREALTYLQKAKHIGKVVVIMPENSNGTIKLKNNLFNDRSTYLITGGLGGIGLEVAKWMVSQGAKYIVLSGRNKPNETAIKIIDDLNESGAIIKVTLADVGTLQGCKNLLNTIKDQLEGLPPLKGIMHCAGCLSDALIANQTKESFEVAFNAKVNGGWNLHQLTLDTYNLEHFVMFSSISAVFGAMGQANYAAANSYLDTLTHYRQALGLPATSINWGQWDQVGMAKGMTISGLVPFSPAQGLNALESALKTKNLQTAVVLGDINTWKSMYPWTKKYFEDLKSTTSENQGRKGNSHNQDLNHDKFWKDLENADKPDLKNKVLQSNVSSIMSNIMKTDNKFEVNQHFEELGLDSLMRIEMKNKIQSLLGKKITLSLSDISDCNTIHLLANRLMELIYGNNDKEVLRESLQKLIREDCILPPHIKANGICTIKPSEIKVVLVTGVTGNLGPYILEDLSNRQQLSRIYCIVRAKKSESGRDRLTKCLKEKRLPYKTCMEKVVVIEGNVSEINLGLSPETYEMLSTEVDAVINIAVKSSYIEEYRKTEGNFTDTRTVNTIGSLRVLEFASAKKTKLVFQASSLLAARKGGENGIVPETWPKEDEFDDSPNFGYATSKYIADRLMAQAVDVGIPCKVFRFAVITGESKTGFQDWEDNHWFVRYMHYLKSGMVPSMKVPLQIMSVDVCANLSLRVFFEDEAPSGVYHIYNPHQTSEIDLPLLGKQLGYPINIVEYSEFVKKIVEDGEKSGLFTMTEFYTDDERYLKFVNDSELLQWYAKHSDTNFFLSEKLTKLIPNLMDIVETPFEILKRDIKYVMDRGAF